MPEAVKSERLAMLQELLNAQQLAFNTSTLGKRVPVLFERLGRKDGQLVGRSPFMQSVHAKVPAFRAEGFLGRVLPVTVTEAHPNSVAASLLPETLDESRGQCAPLSSNSIEVEATA